MIDVIEVGAIGTNAKGFKFQVLEKVSKCRWKLRFIDSGYISIAANKEIYNGKVKDWLSPSVCGVGIVGLEIVKPQSHYLYDRWRDMLRRCYDTKCKPYGTYGARGYSVCKEWLYFPNYVKDIEAKENSIYLQDKMPKWEIDKDILNLNNKIYSNNTTCIVSKEDNLTEMFNRCGYVGDLIKKEVMQFTQDGKYINTFDSMTDALKSLNKNNKTNVTPIWHCCNKLTKTYAGYCWMYKDDFINYEKAKKDIQERMKPKKRKNAFIYQQLDSHNCLIKEFTSIAEISKEFNIPEPTIRSAFNRTNYNYGFYWNRIRR